MENLDNMLMIGSSGPNAGKTELACRLIRKFSRHRDITGIKVTTIKSRDGRCPRGGQGCGVCSSLQGDYLITEETNTDSKKDTARLLRAGAKKVFWLRVLKDHLNEGLKAVLDKTGTGGPLICESNSLRTAVEPGVFLMVENNGHKWKKTASAVEKYVDQRVTADFDIERIKLSQGGWFIRRKAGAIILAGGHSKRLGRDKTILPIQGKPMIQHIYEQLYGCFENVIISSDKPCKYSFLKARVAADEVTGRGPLQGIVSALKACDYEINFVTACDIPEIDMSLVNEMMRFADDYDAVLPMSGGGKPEPLFAIYRKRILPVMEESLSSGQRRIIEPLEKCRVKYVRRGGNYRLFNINSMDDYLDFLKSKRDGTIPAAL